MTVCPFCRAEVPDDSHFCDQCGKEFLFCPECGRPKRGTICAACGADLIKAGAFFAGASGRLSLSGEGLVLPVVEGEFGRRGGIWPELSEFQYVSGLHGRIARDGDAWSITDLGSTNGTRVNGTALLKDKPCIFRKGDSIEIATSLFDVI